MLDYIVIQQCLDKDSPFLANCNPFSSRLNALGWETYTLAGCRELEVYWHPENHILKIMGSFAYFFKGHNRSFSRSEFVEVVNILQSLLGVGLWNAEVLSFEYGAIFPVEDKTKDYIFNHSASPKSKLNENFRGKDKGAGKWWDDKNIILKLYDVQANIRMKKLNKIVAEVEWYFPEGNFLKFEAKFLKPHLLKQGLAVTLEDLQNQQWLAHLDELLLSQYKLLSPMKTLVEQQDKKKNTAIDILLEAVVVSQQNQGIPMCQTKKYIYSLINQKACLSKSDKGSRKATIRKAFANLQEAEKSKWDVSAKIAEALSKEKELQ